MRSKYRLHVNINRLLDDEPYLLILYGKYEKDSYMSNMYFTTEGNQLNFNDRYVYQEIPPSWFDSVKSSIIYECTTRKDMDKYLESNDYVQAIDKLKIMTELEK